MKLKLTRAARIRHEAGEIVEVSPAEAGFLLSTGSAVRVSEYVPARETPEDAAEKETRTEAAPKITTKKDTKK